ncbi:hypothetical protein [Bifidobacterium sp. ESL0790]|uniref:hypothetical protein n=1 Tax=Bifidobacterium sp. ESL0790 TaxID=2983233 RepID=UPI0023F9C33F|nr:hypothetical protein [Bifidobacterium sp. ESL0790]WEV72819.1 hypothetical protein OZY47_02280 [Bifidobacterium sp. ESL0790]
MGTIMASSCLNRMSKKPIMLSESQIRQKIQETASPFGGEAKLRSKEKRNILSLDEMFALQRIDSLNYLLTGE